MRFASLLPARHSTESFPKTGVVAADKIKISLVFPPLPVTCLAGLVPRLSLAKLLDSSRYILHPLLKPATAFVSSFFLFFSSSSLSLALSLTLPRPSRSSSSRRAVNGCRAATMRRTLQKIAPPASRSLHTGLCLPTRRPQRCFHQSTFAALPRKRDFFTSNQLMSSASSDLRPDHSSNFESGHASAADSGAGSDQRLAVKRKLARSSANKKALRATSITNKSARVATESRHSASEIVDDELDYMHTIRAVSIAQSFDMDLVEESLTDHGFAINPDNADLESSVVIHARSYNNGDIFVFNSGTVVAWSVPADAVMNIATRQLLGAARYPYVDLLEYEDLDFSTDETRDHSFMRGEEVVLGTRDGNSQERRLDTTMAKIAFSMGLARSTKLAVLENKLDQFLEVARPVARTLAGGSELSQSRKDILKYTGDLLSLRSQLNHYSELTDDLPDIFWDKESKIENYYTHVSRILDINPRIRQLNAKIDYANETVSVMREMSSEKQGHRLEWIIIVLISVEVLFELRRIYREEVLEVDGKPVSAE